MNDYSVVLWWLFWKGNTTSSRKQSEKANFHNLSLEQYVSKYFLCIMHARNKSFDNIPSIKELLSPVKLKSRQKSSPVLYKRVYIYIYIHLFSLRL